MNVRELKVGESPRQLAGGTSGKGRFRIVSPAGMLATAVILIIVYLALHALGLRENVSLIFATSSGGSSGQLAWGLVYVASYVGGVVLAPILTLAAGIHFGIARLMRPDRPAKDVCPTNNP